MAESTLEKRVSRNFTLAHLDGWDDLDNYTFKHPQTPWEYPRKLFLKDALGLTGMEVSLNKMLPGEEMPFCHTHRANEELYVFIKGRGQFQIDGEVVDVKEGSVIRISPGGIRVWRNNSDGTLYYIVVQARTDTLSGSDISDGRSHGEKPRWPD